MTDLAFKLYKPNIVSDVIDGEAIIMDMQSGNYYSIAGFGAVLWQIIDEGYDQDQILSAIELAFPCTSARQEVPVFFNELVSRALVIRQASKDPGRILALDRSVPYANPILSCHEDMKDLIQLDPIHDVEEAGWPVRKIEA